jgi:hypothetical protein
MYYILYIIYNIVYTIYSQTKVIIFFHILMQIHKKGVYSELASNTCQSQVIDKDNAFQILTKILMLCLQILT